MPAVTLCQLSPSLWKAAWQLKAPVDAAFTSVLRQSLGALLVFRGLEAAVGVEQMADLIAWLKQP